MGWGDTNNDNQAQADNAAAESAGSGAEGKFSFGASDFDFGSGANASGVLGAINTSLTPDLSYQGIGGAVDTGPVGGTDFSGDDNVFDSTLASLGYSTTPAEKMLSAYQGPASQYLSSLGYNSPLSSYGNLGSATDLYSTKGILGDYQLDSNFRGPGLLGKNILTAENLAKYGPTVAGIFGGPLAYAGTKLLGSIATQNPSAIAETALGMMTGGITPSSAFEAVGLRVAPKVAGLGIDALTSAPKSIAGSVAKKSMSVDEAIAAMQSYDPLSSQQRTVSKSVGQTNTPSEVDADSEIGELRYASAQEPRKEQIQSAPPPREQVASAARFPKEWEDLWKGQDLFSKNTNSEFTEWNKIG